MTSIRGKKGTRRPVILAFAAVLAILGIWAATVVGSETAGAAREGSDARACAPGVDFLGFSDALDKRIYERTTVGGLSDLAYDGRENRYYGLVDNGPGRVSKARFYDLRLPLAEGRLGDPRILDVTTLRDAEGRPFTASNFDGEGLALARNGLFVSSETEPSIRRFSLDGRLKKELPVPRKFGVAPEGQATSNETFESLALGPNGRTLFTAVEGPLAPDGSTADGRNRLRILRYDDRGRGFKPAKEFYYRTNAGLGAVEIAALSGTELLLLERGFVPDFGNTVRVFEVSLEGAEDVSNEPSLAQPGLKPVGKELLVDLADCPSGGATTPGTQPNPLLDNYESLTLGPRLSGGRRSLLLVSDDNFSDQQVTRVVALGPDERALR